MWRCTSLLPEKATGDDESSGALCRSDEIGLRYNSHRTRREEYLVMAVMSLWKGSRGMWRIRGSVCEVLRFPESVETAVTGRGGVLITETVRKTAMQIRWRGMYQGY